MHEQWTNFFLGQAGAAAALTGLLVVAISININEIVGDRALAGRAGENVAILAGSLVAASLALIPVQDRPWLGLEVAAVGIFVWAILVRTQITAVRQGLGKAAPTFRSRVFLTQVATVPTVAAGVLLAIGQPAGYAVLAFGILATFAVGILGAWVLLVEILR